MRTLCTREGSRRRALPSMRRLRPPSETPPWTPGTQGTAQEYPSQCGGILPGDMWLHPTVTQLLVSPKSLIEHTTPPDGDSRDKETLKTS